MMITSLLAAWFLTMISTTAGAASVGPELISDLGFDNPSSWDAGIWSS